MRPAGDRSGRSSLSGLSSSAPTAGQWPSAAWTGQSSLWDSDTGAPVGNPMNGNGDMRTPPHSQRTAASLQLDVRAPPLQLWDTGTLRTCRRSDGYGLRSPNSGVQPGREHARGGCRRRLHPAWDVGDQTQLGSRSAVTNHVDEALTSARTERRLLSASDDHTIRVWPALRTSTELLCAKLPTT